MPSTITVCRKTIITGTGRAGTTFLVRLLTELGLDTGFTRETWKKDFHAHSQAGLEHDITARNAPYIVKNPALCTELAPLLAAGVVEIDHAFIPIRELNAAALSRARIGGANGNVPGGLWLTDDPAGQQAALATVFHGLVHTLVAHEIPFTFLHFPRLVQEPRYAFQQLGPVLKGVGWETFLSAFKRVSDPTLVHKFDDTKTAAVDGAIGQEYLRNKAHLRRKRRFLRVAKIAGGLTLAIAIYLLCQL